MLEKYFDKIYCINLDKRIDRWIFFKNQCEKYSINSVERISAVDGDLINQNDYSNKFLKGEIGLLLTSIKIFEDAIDNGYENILLFEDDCLINDNFLKLNKYFNHLPEDWVMLYFGANHNTHGGWEEPEKINNMVLKLSHSYSAHMIGFKKIIFNEILTNLKSFTDQNDVVYSKLQKKYPSYCFTPILATQLVGFSDIQNKEVDYNWLIK
jgi:GR25 family glycosyltransferase involved in LPS biosynthesis